MPVDCEGNRADIVVDPNGTLNRMNPARLYEQYISAAAAKAEKIVHDILQLPKMSADAAKMMLLSKDEATIWAAMGELIQFHTITNPLVGEWFKSGRIGRDPIDFLATVLESGVCVYYPPDNQAYPEDVVLTLEKSKFRPPYGKVSYVGNSGIRRTTRENIRIGSLYIIQLNKPGDDWNATATYRLHHYGVPAVITKADKNLKPTREQPTRGTGESELRSIIAYCGGMLAAEILDRNNSPQIGALIADTIQTCENPANIERIVDREKHPFGTQRPLMIVNHMLACAGGEFVYNPYQLIS